MQNATQSEWRRGWTLVLASMLGVALGSSYFYSTGLFIQPLEREFGWSRAQITGGISIISVVGVFGSPFVGRLIDKGGPRRIALPGSIFFCLAIASLSFASASIWTWWGLWVIMALAALFMATSIWAVAVSSMFTKNRGIALAIMLCGTGLATGVTPLLTNTLINHFGWRGAYIGLGAVFALVVVPMIWLFFFDAKHRDRLHSKTEKRVPAVLLGWTVRQGLRSRQFYQLLIAGFVITTVVVGFAVHLVPLVGEFGIERNDAVKLAAIIGITSIVGRLTVGYFLDRMPGPPIGMISMSFPVITAGILLFFPDSSIAVIVAVGFLGLAIGGEFDAIIYLSTRFFGLKNYGALFGFIASALVAGAGLGPLLAGLLFDKFGSYHVFLLYVIPLSCLSALMLGTLGQYPNHVLSPELDEESPARNVLATP